MLQNAANLSVVPTEFSAELTTNEALEGKFVTVNSSVAGADQVRSRTEVLEGKFRNLKFSPSTRKTTEYSFELFRVPLIKLFLTFVVLAKTRVTMRFRAKNAGYSTGLYHKQPRRVVSGVHLKIEKGENMCNSTK